MKKTTDHSIESQKLFPVFAWAILLMFTGFVYLLTIQLQDVADSLVTTAAINAAIVEGIQSATSSTAVVLSAE